MGRGNSVTNSGMINVIIQRIIGILLPWKHRIYDSSKQSHFGCSACPKRQLDSIIMNIGWHLPEIFDLEGAETRKSGAVGSFISNAEVALESFGWG